MSTTLQPATTDRADGTPQVEVSENVSADNGSLSGTGASSRRGSRTVNACEQCQRRKTKCTGQPSPCEACTKNDLACHFDTKPNMRSRIRAAYSAEDGRLQYLLNAILHALKYGDTKALESLMAALRQNEPPEVIAMHLRNNMSALQEHGHIPNMTIDQADLISLASRINNPAISSTFTAESDADDEVYPYHLRTADSDTPLSETHSLIPIEQYSQQSFSNTNGASYSPIDTRQSYSSNSQSIFTQATGEMAMEPSFPHFVDPSNQMYQQDRYSDGAQIHGIRTPNAMYQSFYIDPYTAAQTTSNYNQFYPIQQHMSSLQADTSMFDASRYIDPTVMRTLPTLHEDMSAQNFSQSSLVAAGHQAQLAPRAPLSPMTQGFPVDSQPRQDRQSFERKTDGSKHRQR